MATMTLSLSDAGWAGTLVCGGLLLVLRLLRDQLRALEQRANASLASVLTRRLWRFSPARLRQLGVLLQVQHGASVLLSGAFLGCLTMSVSAKLVQRPLVAIAVAALPAFALWLPLGRAMWLTRRARARHDPQRGRAAPPTLATGEEDSCTADRRLPVTVVTGFLGAGKSTLIKRILCEEHGKKLLVIENELGEEAIDHELLVQGGEEEIVVLKNGCLCCTVRQDLRTALRALLPRAAALDGVLIETTGVARPAPVVQTFLWDTDLKDRLRLDAVITLVDCKHALRLLAPSPRGGGGAAEAEAAATASLFSESAEACREQIAFADRLLLNKAGLHLHLHLVYPLHPACLLPASLPPALLLDQVDLATADEQAAVAAAARAINPTARVFACCRADAPLHELLGQHAFESSAALERLPQLRRPPSSGELEPHEAATSLSSVPPSFLPHALRVESVSLAAAELDLDLFNTWVGDALQRRGEHILRIKGILAVRGYECKFVFHGAPCLGLARACTNPPTYTPPQHHPNATTTNTIQHQPYPPTHTTMKAY
jgi:G3E family GTPase